ncbi:MAG: helicase-associated domain-containing protein [Candidatus Dormibacteria bacterium]
MNVAGRLQQLAAPDLEELLLRRPETVAVLASGELGWERLASALVRLENLVAVFDSLNLFLRQVLELAVFSGGSLSAEGAAREGLEGPWFEQARRELSRWGLAFPGGGGQIEILPHLSRLIWDPGSLGQGAEFMLEAQKVDVLRPMATNMGLNGVAPPARKADVVKALVLGMSDSARVRALLEQAPTLARSSFDLIRNYHGYSDSSWSNGQSWAWRWHPDQATDGPWWLVGHGLALPREKGASELVVPAEVELALRGRLVPDWELSAPTVPTAPLSEGRHPLELVASLSSLLQELRGAPVPALQQGGLPKRVVKRLATVVKVDEELVEELAALALEAGLLTEVEIVPEQRTRSRRNPRVIQSRQAEIRVSSLASAWEARSEPERWVDFGRKVLLGGGDPMAAVADHLEVTRILNFLLQLPPGQGGRAEALARALQWSYPAVFPSLTVARRHLLAMGSALAWLGAGGGEPAIGLSPAGRLLAGPAELNLEELDRAFPAAVDACTVTSDHRVVVSGPPSSGLSRFLGRIADVESVQPARVYRLSEASLRRGLDGGISPQDIADGFRLHCPTGLPQNVAAMIEDVVGRHGRLRVGAAGVYVVADDPAEIDALAKGRALRPLSVRRLAPTVAVVEAKSVDQVLGLLRKAGLMPVPDIGVGEAVAAQGTPPRGRAESKTGPASSSPARVPGPPAVRVLVRRLRQSPVLNPGEVTDTSDDRAAAIEVVTRAVGDHKAITLGYLSLGGKTVSVLRVTPFSVADGILQAYESRMREILMLDLQRVVWAEQTDSQIQVGRLTSGSFADQWEMYDDDDDDEDDDDEDDDSDYDLILKPPGWGD